MGPAVPGPVELFSMRDEEVIKLVKELHGSEADKSEIRGLYGRFFSSVVKNPSRENEDLLLRVSEMVSPGRVAATCGEALKYQRTSEGRGCIEKVMDGLLTPHGLKASSMMDAWMLSEDLDYRDKAFASNMDAIVELEKVSPGASKVLNSMFAIKCFGRYKIQTLKRQYEERGRTPENPGVVIMPEKDFNGAFYLYSDLMERLSRGLGVKIIESRGVISLYKTLSRLREKYGRRFEFSVDGAHGEKDAIFMGGSDVTGVLSQKPWKAGKKSVLEGEGFRRGAQRLFVENPTHILISCDTGVEGGVGEKIGEKTGANVIAPPFTGKKYGIKKFEWHKRQDGKIGFDVEFLKYEGEE